MSVFQSYQDKNTYNYEKIFGSIRAKFGEPEYVIGVTFGVDFEKWRVILKSLFKGFKEKELFDKAFLFVDKVSIVDTNGRRELIRDSLKYKVSNVSGYLHTKFVLLKFEDKYILVISSKNISNSGSYDIIFPLISQKAEAASHGETVYKYLCYLAGDEDKLRKIFEADKISSIKKCDFVPMVKGWTITDFEIAYGNGKERNEFTTELWDSVLLSDLIISPFLEGKMIDLLEEKHKSGNSVKLLAYPDHISKVISECEDSNNTLNGIEFYMGKVIENSKRVCSQARFHSKLYASQIIIDGVEYSHIIVGSANLTSQAKESHCEILIGINIPGLDAYKTIESIFERDAEAYDKEKALLVDYDSDNDMEEGVLCSAISDSSKIYVKKRNTDFELHVLKFHKDAHEDVVWGMPYKYPVFYVTYGDRMLYIEKSIYLDESEIQMYGGLTYEEYNKEVERNLERFKKENDNAILLGGRGLSYPGQKKEYIDKKRIHMECVPCFFNAVFQRIAEVDDMKDNTLESETLKNVLENLKDVLYEEENITFVNKLLESLE